MSTKSYTLADGTTATVNATDNGVEFNEDMGVLSKAIKAKIDTSSSGGASSGKPVPELYVEDFSAGDLAPLDETHPITYTGGETYFEIYVKDDYEPNSGEKLGATITGNASTGYNLHITAPAGIYNSPFILLAYPNKNYKEAYCIFNVDTGD